jgi:hypothetical protein
MAATVEMKEARISLSLQHLFTRCYSVAEKEERKK